MRRTPNTGLFRVSLFTDWEDAEVLEKRSGCLKFIYIGAKAKATSLPDGFIENHI